MQLLLSVFSHRLPEQKRNISFSETSKSDKNSSTHTLLVTSPEALTLSYRHAEVKLGLCDKLSLIIFSRLIAMPARKEETRLCISVILVPNIPHAHAESYAR